MTYDFSVDATGFAINGQSAGQTLFADQALVALGPPSRTKDVIIERKVERVMRFYDAAGFGVLACQLCNKVLSVWVNLRPGGARATTATFQGDLTIMGHVIRDAMTTRQLFEIDPAIQQTFRTSLDFAVGGIDVYVTGHVPRRASPDATIQIQSVDLSFRHEQVAPFKSCVG